ncbi:PREDICTED: LOC110768041 isoform, partial [Prunus dulcis]
SVKWGPISKEQEDEVEWVRAQLSETELAGIIRGSTKVAVDIDEAEMQKRLRESRAKKAEKGAGKRPRDDDEGRVADVLGKRKALEEAHQHVMGSGPRLPPFDLQAPPKLPFGMEDVFAEGVEKVDFGRLRQQKKEVNLAMHLQEVPLVNVFLEGVKSDPEALARTPAFSFIDRAQKKILTSAY